MRAQRSTPWAVTEALQPFREQLDALDTALLELLAKRSAVVASIGEAKWQHQIPLRDRRREASLLSRLEALGAEHDLPPTYVRGIFKEIIEHALRVQQQHFEAAAGSGLRLERLLYQGAPGAYSHQAAQRHASGYALAPEIVGMQSFRAMLEAVAGGEADAALLPLENTTAGSINDAYDLLLEFDLYLVGEELQPVEHCLLTLDNSVELSEIRRVLSHPQALAQCGAFLRALPYAQPEPFMDTALGAEQVQRLADRQVAAIASAGAAEIYGLHVKAEQIADQRLNTTRMVLVANEPRMPPPGVPTQTSLVFALKHESAALRAVLDIFAQASLSLTKLESRPRANHPWHYVFYADLEGAVGDEVLESDWYRALQARCVFVRWLGTYAAQPRFSDLRLRRGSPGALPASEAAAAALRQLGFDPGSHVPLRFYVVSDEAVAAGWQGEMAQADAFVLPPRPSRALLRALKARSACEGTPLLGLVRSALDLKAQRGVPLAAWVLDAPLSEAPALKAALRGQALPVIAAAELAQACGVEAVLSLSAPGGAPSSAPALALLDLRASDDTAPSVLPEGTVAVLRGA